MEDADLWLVDVAMFVFGAVVIAGFLMTGLTLLIRPTA